MTSKKITVKNQMSQVNVVFDALTEFMEENNISFDDDNDSNTLCMCMDELFSNIVNYAYDDKDEHDIDIVFQKDEETKKLRIILLDDGKEFNPLVDAEDPDLTLDIMDREIGGLGVFIVTNIMTNVEYERQQKKNQLTLEKNIE